MTIHNHLMSGNDVRIVNPHDLFKKKTYEYMNGSLSIPSTFHAYSISCDYIRQWFLSKFREDYFKKVHMNDSNVYKDYRNFSIMKTFLESTPPLLAITPNMNFQYNRNFLDSNPYGIDHLIRSGNIENTIIKDYEAGTFVGVDFEELEIKFNFAIKLESKAQQVDLYRYLTMAFPFGHSYGDIISMDYHIPYNVILQFAKDHNFEINEEKGTIKNLIKFLNFINSKSTVPIVYKHRSINGRQEFFFRDTSTNMRVNLYDLPDPDTGESRGMIKTNYRIDFEMTVYIPSPKFYIYYSTNKHNYILGISDVKKMSEINQADLSESHVPLYTIEMHKIPNMNEKNWNRLMHTDYVVDEYEDIRVDISSIFYQYKDIIDHYVKIGYNIDDVIEIRLYNGTNYNVKHRIDWKNMDLIFMEKVESTTTKIVIYMDTKTVNNDLINLKDWFEYGKSRVNSEVKEEDKAQ